MAIDPTDPATAEILKEFTTVEIANGIYQYAEVKLSMTGKAFIEMVRRGEDVSKLHKRAQEVADLVALLPEDLEFP